jgi:hypothetical protein
VSLTRLVMILKIHPLIVKLGEQTIYLVPFNQLAKLFDLFNASSTLQAMRSRKFGNAAREPTPTLLSVHFDV